MSLGKVMAVPELWAYTGPAHYYGGDYVISLAWLQPCHSVLLSCCLLPQCTLQLLLVATVCSSVVACCHSVLFSCCLFPQCALQLLLAATVCSSVVACCHSVLFSCCLLPQCPLQLLLDAKVCPSVVACCQSLLLSCCLLPNVLLGGCLLPNFLLGGCFFTSSWLLVDQKSCSFFAGVHVDTADILAKVLHVSVFIVCDYCIPECPNTNRVSAK